MSTPPLNCKLLETSVCVQFNFVPPRSKRVPERMFQHKDTETERRGEQRKEGKDAMMCVCMCAYVHVCYRLFGFEIKGKETGSNNFWHQPEYKMYIIVNLYIAYFPKCKHLNDHVALVKQLEFPELSCMICAVIMTTPILQDCWKNSMK